MASGSGTPPVTSSPPAQKTDLLLSTALASASSLVLLQLFSRIFTFILNQALVRLVSPQVFGTAAIQFELLLSTILFLAREGVRSALLRAQSPPNKASADNSPRARSGDLITNISVLPSLLGIPASVLISLIYINTTSASTSSQPYFVHSVAIYTFAACFELLAEPLYIRSQNEFRFDLRVRAEGLAVFFKTVVTFVVLAVGSAQLALLAFALGQAAYGLAVLASYIRAYGSLVLWPKKVALTVHGNTKSMYFDPELLQLSRAMTSQSLVKHFLTEGDKFLVSRLSPLADQGGYAVASNYGSLIARIIFQPIEETSRVFFSKTLSASPSDKQAALQSVSGTLSGFLLLFAHLFLFLVAFGPPYLPLAVTLLLPPRFLNTSAPTILRTYVYYIPTMAFNGVLEAFFASASAPADLHAQSRWMFVFSLGFVAVAVGLAKGLGLGDAGLVWANVANLLCRAAYAWAFVLRYFRESGAGELVDWRKSVPPVKVLIVFAACAAVMRMSEQSYGGYPLTVRDQMGHIGTALLCLGSCLTACYAFERKTFIHIYESLRKR
ncbi:hypothetical protein AcW1_007356 [Taiwanofungus camphoratus]|nr:hypothetical protein AcV7_006067 [Antrodia cinnamomea]KAI0927379.1 hypothetical protein AcV5_007932 [Antrodia cinnamomea]KAI0953032.1 hypothetical protein AcW1_007356 [Antrodia cinnamomea]